MKVKPLFALLVCSTFFLVSSSARAGGPSFVVQKYQRAQRTIELPRNLNAVSFSGDIERGTLESFFRSQGAFFQALYTIGHRQVAWYRFEAGANQLESHFLARELSKELGARSAGGVFYDASALAIHTGMIWVYFPQNTKTAVAQSRLDRLGVQTAKFIRATHLIALVSPTAGQSVDDCLVVLQKAGFEAEPELMRSYRYHGTPSDPLFPQQWYLNNDGHNVSHALTGNPIDGQAYADARVLSAWNHTMGRADIRIAVIDSGTDCGHPELVLKCESPYDAPEDDLDISPGEGVSDGHGTSVAGIVAAGADGVGMVGVCPGCGLIPIRLMSWGIFATDEMILRSFKHAVDSGAYVINNSWGPSAPGDFLIPISQGVMEGIAYAKTARGGLGALVVFAAGNDDDDTARIGNYTTGEPHVLCVGATDHMDHRTSYSNFGDYLDISAPSIDKFYPARFLTLERVGMGNLDGDYTSVFGGTSASAPIVSGVAGLMFSMNPSLSAEEVKQILLETADKIEPDTGFWDDKGHSPKYGYGRVNAYRAVLGAGGLLDALCETPTLEDCATHLDENCNSFIDEGCGQSSKVGQRCESPEDCGDETDWLCPSVGLLRGVCTLDCTLGICPAGSVCEKGQCAVSCSKENPCDEEADLICNHQVLGECFSRCKNDEECSEGEICKPETELCHMNTDGLPGSPCTTNECVGDLPICLSEMMGFPGGYCSHMCSTHDDCEDLGKCIETARGLFCYSACSMDGECRQGYLCMQAGPRAGTCYKPCTTDTQCQEVNAGDENVVCDQATSRCVERDVVEPDTEKELDSDTITNSTDLSDTSDSASSDTDSTVEDLNDKGCSCRFVKHKSSSLLSIIFGLWT